MSFELRIYPYGGNATFTGTPAPRVITQANAGGLLDGFKWQLRPNGGTVQLEFTGRNDRLGIMPYGVVQLLLDGSPAFYGCVADPPSMKSTTAERITALGGREILRKKLSDGKPYANTVGIFTIVRDLLSRLCPQGLTYIPTFIGDGTGGDTGPTLSTFYKPYQSLDKVLDALAKSANVSWDVDNEGKIFFGRPVTEMVVVPYVSQPWSRLQIEGRETVSKAYLRILTLPVVPANANTTFDGGVPGQVMTTATAADHPTYGCEDGFSVPQGVSVTRTTLPAGAGASNESSIAGAADADPNTFSIVDYNTGSQSLSLVSELNTRILGVEIDYTAIIDTAKSGATFRGSLNIHLSNCFFDLPASVNRRTERILLPPGTNPPATWDARIALGGAFGAFGTPRPTSELRVYGIRFIVVDEAAALRVASSFLQVPFKTPAEVKVNYIAAPGPTVTVTGSPDGDVTGPAALYEYEHSFARLRTTTIKLGATGQSDEARSIKFSAQTEIRGVMQ